jgi:hypothetical protein
MHMPKIKTGFAEAAKDELHKDELKHKHELPDNAVIIEKTNTAKFLLSFFKTFIKTAAGVLLITLAAIGVVTLLYPSLRGELAQIIAEVFNTVK